MNIGTKKTSSLFLLLTLFSIAHSLCNTNDVNLGYIIHHVNLSDDQHKPALKARGTIDNQDVEHAYSIHPRRTQSHYDFRSHINFASMSSDDFRNKFRYASSEDEVLNDTNLELFAYQGFQEYAQTLSYYYDFILSLDTRIKNDKSFYNKTKNMPGFEYSFFLWSEKSEFHNFIKGEANRIKTEKNKLSQQARDTRYLNLDNHNALQDLSNKYQEYYDLARKYSNYPLTLRYKKRLSAIKATMQQNGCKHDYASIVKQYPTFTDQDAHVFNHCYGSKLDQHLHEELCETREKAMRLQSRNFNSLQLQIITPAIYRLTAQAKTDRNPHSAFKLSDFSYALTNVLSDCMNIARKAGCAVGRGTISGVKTVLSPEHWKDMALGIINLGAFAFKEMVLQEGVDQAFFSLNAHDFNKQSTQHYQYNQAQMQALEKHINSTLHQLKKMPWDQLLEKGVELGVTITLDTLALQALGNFSSKASRAFVDNLSEVLSSPVATEYVVEVASIGKIAIEEGNEIATKVIDIVKNNRTRLVNECNTIGKKTNLLEKIYEQSIHGLIKKSKNIESNIQNIRDWAISKGWVQKYTEGGVEIWGVTKGNGLLSWRVKIKEQPSMRQGLGSGSKIPRFDVRIDEGRYYNPFTGETGGKSVGTHIPLKY